METTAANLKRYRRRVQMTQEDVANYLQINRSTYSRYEEGTNRPNYIILSKLADLYDITIDELVGRIPERTNEPSRENSGDGSDRDETSMISGLLRMQGLFLNATAYARETALLILENGQDSSLE